MKEDRKIEIFVPGRISILGGLSDIASKYLKENKKIAEGHAIASCVNLGIYAEVQKEEKFLQFQMNEKELRILMTKENLKKVAKDKGFYSYICGTSLYMLENYNISGINIKIKKMDLPIGKGLASSAASCILVVKAFNELYKLNMSSEEIKKAAYEGEHNALSDCGLLDQTAILEKNISKIIFKEDRVISERVVPENKIKFLIVDLGGYKDTGKIMDDLNSCFPYYKDNNQKKVHKMMGKQNIKLVNNSVKAIESGNMKALGRNMNKAQKLIDKCEKVCEEFKAPKLHKIMKDKKIRQLSYGIKGLGSGGDGSAEILVKDLKAKIKLKQYIEKKFNMKVYCIELNK